VTSPNSFDLELFEQVLRTAASMPAIDKICQELKVKARRGIYRLPVVIWLMIFQRLNSKGTLSSAVHFLARQAVHWKNQRDACKRVAEQRISTRTGGYSQARCKLPKLLASYVCDHIFQELQALMRTPPMELARPVYVIDGTTLRLAHEQELKRAFPPGRNQHGENHWPTMLLVAFHDAHTGLAMRPSWGAMYGPRNVSEQALARAALERLPADAVAMGDSGFGIFWFAYEVHQARRDGLLRLTVERALKVLHGAALRPGRRRKVEWEASAWERKSRPDLPPEAKVRGWVVACRNPGHNEELLYFFTTLDLPPKRILALYKLRWNIETDLRSLKRTLELHQLTSKTQSMVEKELLMGVCAYNVVRAVMYLSASQAGQSPRQLSFSAAQDAVIAAWPYLQRAGNQAEFQQEIERLLEVVSQSLLPQRVRRRSYPREIWGRGGHFPFRHSGNQEVKE
jgi:putative transposase